MNYKTEQEEFWIGEFGNDYVIRNNSDEYLASNLNFFSKTFSKIKKPSSVIEFGANIGMNLQAIKLLYPSIDCFGIEINKDSAEKLKQAIGIKNVFEGSIFNFIPIKTYDIAMTKGVLIHINPEYLDEVYQKLYDSSNLYVLICEYYNPSPIAIEYRGHSNKLFKRDFAGEILKKFEDLALVDYGFVYKKDPSFPQDDITWFLLKKQNKSI